jgi:hypothetical protein
MGLAKVYHVEQEYFWPYGEFVVTNTLLGPGEMLRKEKPSSFKATTFTSVANN